MVTKMYIVHPAADLGATLTIYNVGQNGQNDTFLCYYQASKVMVLGKKKQLYKFKGDSVCLSKMKITFHL